MRHKSPFWKLIWAGTLSAALLLSGAAAVIPENESVTFSIYTTADMAGRTSDTDPLTGQNTPQNYLKVATAMTQERSVMDDVLLLDAGGSVTTTSSSAVSAALTGIGYDALIPGWEEFQLAAGDQTQFFHSLGTTKVLSANILNRSSQAPAYTPYEIFSLTAGEQTIRVGVLGLGAMDAPEQVPASHYNGLCFSHSQNTTNSYAWEWTYIWQPVLEQEACDLVVVVCHGSNAELTAFATETTGIDLLVGGHGIADTKIFQNAAGEAVSYVNGGGHALTRTTVTLSPDGSVKLGSSNLLELESYESDPALSATLSSFHAATERQALQPLAVLSGSWEDSAGPCYTQTDTTDLVARAMLWASGADVALLSPGLLENGSVAQWMAAGKTSLTLRDCTRLLPDDSPIVVVELTAHQLRTLLDASAGQYTVSTQDLTISGGKNADLLYGLDYDLYLTGSAGQRVSPLLRDGVPIDDSTLLRVAVPACRYSAADFPDVIPTWSSATDERFGSSGGSAACVLAAYAKAQSEQYGSLSPARESTCTLYTSSNGGSLNRLEFVTMLYDLAGRPQPGASAAFVDVTGSDAVIWAAENGIVSGDGKGRFLPSQSVTREQAAVMIYNYARWLGISTPTTGTELTALLDYGDISVWARPAVEFCIRTNALPPSGVRGDLFLPHSTLTRQDATLCLDALSVYIDAQ